MDDCILVYDVIQEIERLVKKKYVHLYPKLFKPVWVDGKRIYWNKK